MIDPRELIARQGAKGSSWGDPGSTFGALKPSDIAAALTHVKDPLGLALLQANYGRDFTAYRRLEIILLDKVLLMAQKWRCRKPEALPKLVAMALQEHMAPDLCGTCMGRNPAVTGKIIGLTQVRKVGGAWVVCPACKGGGREMPSDRSRARKMGIEPMGWKMWEGRYAAINEIICDAEESALRKFALALA